MTIPYVEHATISKRLQIDDDQLQKINRDLHLSRRELELVKHICEGKKLAAIAQEMQLALGTIKTYNQRVHHKLGISDHVELILLVAGLTTRSLLAER